MFLKRKWKNIYLLPCIQPHNLDSVNKCKTKKKNIAKKSLTHPWGSRIGMISIWRLYSMELPWTLFRAFDWLLSQYSCIFYFFVRYFFIETLKIWVSYNLEWLHTLCILIHLLMQPSGVWWVTKTDFISPKNINTIPSRSIFKTEVTVFYHTDRDLAGK